MTADPAKAAALIERIIASGDEDGKASNDLLKEFFRGYPLENLLPLLRSEDDEVVRSGAFIAGELGEKARPLLAELVRLLGHQDGWVRSDMLTAVGLAATSGDGEALAQAIALVNHSDGGTRSKALDLLTWLDRARLAVAEGHLSDPETADCLCWLLSVEESPTAASEIQAMLTSEGRLPRWFAGVAAVRRYQRSPDLLRQTVESNDEELRSFAESRLQMFEEKAALQAARAARKTARENANPPTSG